jgi:hypothetical protein
MVMEGCTRDFLSDCESSLDFREEGGLDDVIECRGCEVEQEQWKGMLSGEVVSLVSALQQHVGLGSVLFVADPVISRTSSFCNVFSASPDMDIGLSRVRHCFVLLCRAWAR